MKPLTDLLIRVQKFLLVGSSRYTLDSTQQLEGELILFDIELLLSRLDTSTGTDSISQSARAISDILEEDEYRRDIIEDELQVQACYNRLMKMSK